MWQFSVCVKPNHFLLLENQDESASPEHIREGALLQDLESEYVKNLRSVLESEAHHEEFVRAVSAVRYDRAKFTQQLVLGIVNNMKFDSILNDILFSKPEDDLAGVLATAVSKVVTSLVQTTEEIIKGK